MVGLADVSEIDFFGMFLALPVFVWMPPIPWAIWGDLHWISSSKGSSPVAMTSKAYGVHEIGFVF